MIIHRTRRDEKVERKKENDVHTHNYTHTSKDEEENKE
jgi:hypothetical protein